MQWHELSRAIAPGCDIICRHKEAFFGNVSEMEATDNGIEFVDTGNRAEILAGIDKPVVTVACQNHEV